MSQKLSTTSSPAKELRGTMTIFIFIAACIFLFLLAAVFIVQSLGPLKSEWDQYTNSLSWIMAILSLGFLILAKRVFNSTIAGAKDSLNPLLAKLSRHRVALVKYLAVCEAAAILNIVLFIFTGEFLFLVFAGVILGFMLAMMPSRRRMVATLELDPMQEKELLDLKF